MAKTRKYRSAGRTSRKRKIGNNAVVEELKYRSIASAQQASRQEMDGKAKENIRMPHLRSTADSISKMGNCNWGITAPDKLGVKTQVVKDGNNWKLDVTHVNSVIRSFSRLLAGQKEPVPGHNTTKTNWKDQVNELNRLGSCAGKWYMIRAVRAHENEHLKEWKDNFDTDWATQRTNIENLTVPASGNTENSAKAHKALRAMPAFDSARETTNASGNYPTFWGLADPNAQTNAAEQKIVDPRIEWICKYAKWNKWNPASNAVCTNKKIT